MLRYGKREVSAETLRQMFFAHGGMQSIRSGMVDFTIGLSFNGEGDDIRHEAFFEYHEMPILDKLYGFLLAFAGHDQEYQIVIIDPFEVPFKTVANIPLFPEESGETITKGQTIH